MTEPVTLTHSEAEMEAQVGCHLTGDAAAVLVSRVARIWPNGIRIVPNPIPEPGPEVHYVEFITLGENPSRFIRIDGGAWMYAFTSKKAFTWTQVLALHPASQGYSLTEHVAKDSRNA